MINNEFTIDGFERYKSDDGKYLYTIKIIDGYGQSMARYCGYSEIMMIIQELKELVEN